MKRKNKPTFFRRTKEEIRLKLNCGEAKKYREENQQREKMKSIFQVKEAINS